MTWQRIDEDTYIDDTLVTCAEYQLFIDEMREQGIYYQPDHWTSYKFPTGKGREPILGVRRSDAGAFCEWLTQKDEEWKYRLPTLFEATNHTLDLLFRPAVGFWNSDVLFRSQFNWTNNKPIDARNIDRNTILRSAYELVPARGPEFEVFLNNAYSLVSNVPLDIQNNSINSFAIDRFLQFTIILSLDRSANMNRSFSTDYVLKIARSIGVLDLIKQIPTGANRNWFIHQSYTSALSLISYTNSAWKKSGISAENICLDMLTLQERIAGRSPAFEGIRLVKERIK